MVKVGSKKRAIFLSSLFILLGFIAGFFASGLTQNKEEENAIITDYTEFHAGGYKFINPLYECSTGQQYGTQELLDLRAEVNKYIDELTLNNTVSRVAVRFRDLNTGPWFGINDTDDFSPSSLLKTPVMMAYFKKAETDPTILTKKIIYNEIPSDVQAQNFPPKNPLQKGKEYTIEQLIEHMIIDSDNAALRILEQNIDNKDIDKVTLDLGITTATVDTPADFMDVAEYSTLFRILYYSTYLNKEYSEKALDLLSKVEFNDGLVSQLPRSVAVAHKFGERSFSRGVYQLHDCGIVYYPKHPYLICVMTKGSNFEDLKTTIQQISKKVYLEYSKIYPN